MNRIEWYQAVSEKINNNIEDFYQAMYGEVLQPVGRDYRVNPCPLCGHNDCCTVSAETNTTKCFSTGCEFRGTHITAFVTYVIEKFEAPKNNKSTALKMIAEWSGIPYPTTGNKAQIEASYKFARQQEIREEAIKFYSKQLLSCKVSFAVQVGNDISSLTPLEYQTKIRQHSLSTLIDFNVGFSANYFDLKNILTSKGFNDEEIKEAKIWFPEGVFIYPYWDSRTGDILRFNTKNAFGVKGEIKGEEREIKGYSVGSKVCGFSPKFRFDKDILIVEGENDALTAYEAGWLNVVWIGGNLDKFASQLSILDLCKGRIYCGFDNDEVGEKYYEILQEKFPHKDVRRIDIPKTYKDIDEYYKWDANAISIFELADKANYEVTELYSIKKIDTRNWVIANRHRRIEFEIERLDRVGQLTGRINYYIIDKDGNENLNDREIDKSLIRCKEKMKPFSFHLSDAIESYFNSNVEEKTFNELVDIFYLSTHKSKIMRELAQRLYDVQGEERDKLVSILKYNLDADTTDTIFKEVNDIQNAGVIGELTHIPKMKISQYFNVSNNDAYMYYTQDKMDGDAIRRIPFLLRNDGQTVRLDLLKRKDKQCLLLVDNKYEIQYEVSEAIMDLRECSLWSPWVEKYRNNELDDDDLNPYKLIKDLENFVKRFYFFKDKNTYKVLALYMYSTYFYELFGQIPYLFLNGEKGSGKSTLDTVLYLFCFNAKLAINITEASLFRMCSFEGGTVILDEMENLTSRAKAAESTMASVLKGGYSRAGAVYRHNSEKNQTEGFDIYGPKIISNIFGVEDVIGDRCIEIRTYRVDLDKDIVIEDPKDYTNEKLDQVREVTSKCCLSALKYFTLMHRIYNDRKTKIRTHSPRTAQIMKPLLAVAKFVDMFGAGRENEEGLDVSSLMGEYETALTSFHDNQVMSYKESMDDSTPEGVIKSVIPQIARELADPNFPHEQKIYTIPDNYRHKVPIEFDLREGWFEVDVVHFKCFLEQHLPGEAIYSRNIAKWIKTSYDVPSRRKVVSLSDDTLIREWNGTTKPKVICYKFYFSDFLGCSFLESQQSEHHDLIDDSHQIMNNYF